MTPPATKNGPPRLTPRQPVTITPANLDQMRAESDRYALDAELVAVAEELSLNQTPGTVGHILPPGTQAIFHFPDGISLHLRPGWFTPAPHQSPATQNAPRPRRNRRPDPLDGFHLTAGPVLAILAAVLTLAAAALALFFGNRNH